VLSTSREVVAEELRQFGEDATAHWVDHCTDDELLRICAVADWLIYRGPATPYGASMLLGKACALAAVYVREGSPRDLVRDRSRPPAPRSAADVAKLRNGRRPSLADQLRKGRDYGVGQDVKDYWTPYAR
jgi:hypothetical protein